MSHTEIACASSSGDSKDLPSRVTLARQSAKYKKIIIYRHAFSIKWLELKKKPKNCFNILSKGTDILRVIYNTLTVFDSKNYIDEVSPRLLLSKWSIAWNCHHFTNNKETGKDEQILNTRIMEGMKRDGKTRPNDKKKKGV